MKKYKLKSFGKDVGLFSVGAVTLGASSAAVYHAGGNTAALTGVGRMMPVMGSLVGLKHTVGLASSLVPNKRKRRL